MSAYTAMETKDTLSEGLIGLLGPSVELVDERVRLVRQSQLELRMKIDSLAEDLKKIQDEQPVPVELDSYVKKLNNSRRRVMLVNNILQNAQERLGKLHANVSKETARRKAQLDQSGGRTAAAGSGGSHSSRPVAPIPASSSSTSTSSSSSSSGGASATGTTTQHQQQTAT